MLKYDRIVELLNKGVCGTELMHPSRIYRIPLSRPPSHPSCRSATADSKERYMPQQELSYEADHRNQMNAN